MIDAMDRCTLRIKHLPKCLSSEQVVDFLKHFNAKTVRYMGKEGSMRYTAFATYESKPAAERALRLLHQVSLLGSVLAVEYSRKNDACVDSQQPESGIELNANGKNKNANESSKSKMSQPEDRLKSKLNYVSSAWDIPYSIDEQLMYSYPKPTDIILRNIMHCIASVPKLYVQVLHLMNKMNLPAPFTLLTTAPPNASNLVSSEESELESANEEESGITSMIFYGPIESTKTDFDHKLLL